MAHRRRDVATEKITAVGQLHPEAIRGVVHDPLQRNTGVPGVLGMELDLEAVDVPSADRLVLIREQHVGQRRRGDVALRFDRGGHIGERDVGVTERERQTVGGLLQNLLERCRGAEGGTYRHGVHVHPDGGVEFRSTPTCLRYHHHQVVGAGEPRQRHSKCGVEPGERADPALGRSIAQRCGDLRAERSSLHRGRRWNMPTPHGRSVDRQFRTSR